MQAQTTPNAPEGASENLNDLFICAGDVHRSLCDVDALLEVVEWSAEHFKQSRLVREQSIFVARLESFCRVISIARAELDGAFVPLKEIEAALEVRPKGGAE